MKNILLILAIAFSSVSFGQGNLQFNQVINYESNVNTGGNSTSTHTSITVPAGKVWKIETCSFHFLQTIEKPVSYSYSNVRIGMNTVFHFTASSNYQAQHLPLWLSEGTYTVIGTSYSGWNVTVAFSAIEFNVVP